MVSINPAPIFHFSAGYKFLWLLDYNKTLVSFIVNAIVFHYLIVSVSISIVLVLMKDFKNLHENRGFLTFLTIIRMIPMMLFWTPIFDILLFSVLCKDYGQGTGVRSKFSPECGCVFGAHTSFYDYFTTYGALYALISHSVLRLVDTMTCFTSRISELGINLRYQFDCNVEKEERV